MEILLAYKAHARGAHDPYTSLLPVGLGYMNAVLRKEGHHSRIANFSKYDWDGVARIIAAKPPALLGVSQFTHNRFDSIKLAGLAKNISPSCFVVLGGPHATHRYHEILSRNETVDAVVMGEGEETLSELAGILAQKGVDALDSIRGLAFKRAGSVVANPSREPLADLDGLPFPAAFIEDAIGLESHRQLEFLITSRGCPAVCNFCSSPKFWGRSLRFRSPRSIVDEIRFIRDRFGLIYFSIRDDTFTADRERVLAFCRLLLLEKIHILWNCQSRVNAVDEEVVFWMKKAGCECVQLGVESGSLKILRTLGKTITREQILKAAESTRRAGIHLSLYLMTGVPGETGEDITDTLSLLESVKADDGQVSPLVYYPGTRLFDEAVKSGMVGGDLFESDTREALYVRSDRFVQKSTQTILKSVERIARRSRFTRADFHAQKKLLGYCHGTNIMAGEFHESRGELREAEGEYREILDREPENPWGWLMIGELYAKVGDTAGARQAFEMLSSLVPAHAPAYSYLGELCLIAGDRSAALRFYRQAISLDPFELTAREGITQISG